MPVILRIKGYRFFFFSNEGDPIEPPHIHVRQAGNVVKYWLSPVEFDSSYGFRPHELHEIERIVFEHRDLLERKWHEHFGD